MKARNRLIIILIAFVSASCAQVEQDFRKVVSDIHESLEVRAEKNRIMEEIYAERKSQKSNEDVSGSDSLADTSLTNFQTTSAASNQTPRAVAGKGSMAPMGQMSGASFDCKMATTDVEKSICADAELGQLDRQVDGAYKNALIIHPMPDYVRARQREWIATRQYCDSKNLRGCLKEMYRSRLTDLSLLDGIQVYSEQRSFSYYAGDTVVEIRPLRDRIMFEIWGAARFHRTASEMSDTQKFTICEFKGEAKSIDVGKANSSDGQEVNFKIKNDIIILTSVSDGVCPGFASPPDQLKLIRSGVVESRGGSKQSVSGRQSTIPLATQSVSTSSPNEGRLSADKFDYLKGQIKTYDGAGCGYFKRSDEKKKDAKYLAADGYDGTAIVINYQGKDLSLPETNRDMKTVVASKDGMTLTIRYGKSKACGEECSLTYTTLEFQQRNQKISIPSFSVCGS